MNYIFADLDANAFLLFVFLFFFLFFNDANLMTRNPKITIQKHNNEKRPETSSLASVKTVKFFSYFFLGFEKQKNLSLIHI